MVAQYLPSIHENGRLGQERATGGAIVLSKRLLQRLRRGKHDWEQPQPVDVPDCARGVRPCNSAQRLSGCVTSSQGGWLWA